MASYKPWIALLALSLLGCPKKEDTKGKVPFGLEDKAAVDPPQTNKEQDAAKEAAASDAASDASDAGDARAPLTHSQMFREQLLRSLRIGKLDQEIRSEALVAVEKVGKLPLRGVTPPVSPSRIAFGAEAGVLLVRGKQGGTYNLEERAFSSKELPPALIRDRNGEYSVVESIVSCEGVRLVLARGNEIVAGVLAGKPVARPWVRKNDDSARCDKAALEPVVFKVLGWTGQGIVFFLDGEFFVQEAPLTSDQPARLLDFEAGLPAPLAAGFVSRDGRMAIFPTSLGLVVYRAGQLPRVVTGSPVSAQSQVSFRVDGEQTLVYWTEKASLYRGRLPARPALSGHDSL